MASSLVDDPDWEQAGLLIVVDQLPSSSDDRPIG